MVLHIFTIGLLFTMVKYIHGIIHTTDLMYNNGYDWSEARRATMPTRPPGRLSRKKKSRPLMRVLDVLNDVQCQIVDSIIGRSC